MSVEPTKPKVTFPTGGEKINGVKTIQWEFDSTEGFPVYSSIHDYNLGGHWQVERIGHVASLAQPFTAPENTSRIRIELEVEAMDYSAYGSGNIEVHILADNNGQPGNTLFERKITVDSFREHTGGRWTLTFDSEINVNLQKGVKYYLSFNQVSGSSETIFYHSVDPTHEKAWEYRWEGGPAFNYWEEDVHSEIHSIGGLRVSFMDLNLPPDYGDLFYQIQLITEIGGTWKDIVTKSPTGISEYEYDFTHEPITDYALIRIRSGKMVNGVEEYSDWVMNGTFFSIVDKIKVGEFRFLNDVLPIYELDEGLDGFNKLRTVDKDGNVACFELVDINDSNASPFRVMTSNGIKAIAKG